MSAAKFGEWFRGKHASENNPHRDGMFVRIVELQRTRCYQLTNGKGEFWAYPQEDCSPVPPADRASPQIKKEYEYCPTCGMPSYTTINQGNKKNAHDSILPQVESPDVDEAFEIWWEVHGGGDKKLFRECWDVATKFKAGHASARRKLGLVISRNNDGIYLLHIDEVDYSSPIFERHALKLLAGRELISGQSIEV